MPLALLLAHRERSGLTESQHGAPRDRRDLPMSDASDEAPEAAPLPIRENILKEILSSGSSKAMQPQAITLSSYLVRAFIEEARSRAAAEAEESGDDEITKEHLEKVLPQLLLDFGP